MMQSYKSKNGCFLILYYVAAFEAQIAELQDKLKDITEERDALLEKKSQLSSTVKELEESNQQLDGKVAELKEQIEELNAKLSAAATATTAAVVTDAVVSSVPAPVITPVEVNADNLEVKAILTDKVIK